MSVPIRPVRPGDLISAAKFNEVVDVVNALGQISGSYPIEVAHDDMGVRIGLARQFKAWLFRIESVPTAVARTDDNVPYYNATRLRLDTTNNYTAQSPQHVVLFDPLAKDVAAKLLTEGTWALANFDADTGRWQIVRDPFPGTQLVRFKLTSTLTLGSSATATIRKWDPAAGGGAGAYVDGDTITVKDYFGALGDPGEWQAPSGYYGFAVNLQDRNEYQILYMEHQAEFVAFTLTSNMSGGSAAATFNSFWMGRNTATETTVYDRQGQFASAKTGEPGIACWDSKVGQYVILTVGTPARELVLFYLNEDLVIGGAADATLRKWIGAVWNTIGSDVVVWDSSLLGPGKRGDIGIAFLSTQSGRYEIIGLSTTHFPQIVRFRLTETLTLGGAASATQQIWDATADGGAGAYTDNGAITVVDYYGSLGRRGAFQAPSGYFGFACKMTDKAEYQILSMERQALFADVTLTSDMSGRSAGCTFDAFWDGQSTASETTIYDTLNFYGSAVSGDKFRVVWDSHDAHYKIIDAKPASAATIRYARAYADHVLAANSKSNAHYVECQAVDNITGDGWDADSEHFHVLLPSPSAATDPNVEASVVIGYTIDGAGNRVCVTDYLDDCRRTIKTWGGTAANIPHGWQLCDGADGTPDLTGRFILGAEPGGSTPFDDSGDSNDVGETGGTLKHTHAAHAAAATSAVTLAATSTAEASTDSEFVGTPSAIDTSPNMTGSPIASGKTGPTALSGSSMWPEVTIEPTELTADHTHDLTLSQHVATNIDKTNRDCYVGSGDSPPDSGCGELTVTTQSNDPSGIELIQPNPHSHAVNQTEDNPDNNFLILEPNPHTHSCVLPVTGITFSPSNTPFTPSGTIVSDTAVEVITTIAPVSHTHMTPTLSHDTRYHVPPYFALCYVMRTS